MQFLESYIREDLTIAELEGSSNSLWTISPPSKKNLIKMLNSTDEKFPLTFTWSIQRYCRVQHHTSSQAYTEHLEEPGLLVANGYNKNKILSRFHPEMQTFYYILLDKIFSILKFDFRFYSPSVHPKCKWLFSSLAQWRFLPETVLLGRGRSTGGARELNINVSSVSCATFQQRWWQCNVT